MDIYFVRISHEEAYTMSHITKDKINKWFAKNEDIADYLYGTIPYWGDAEFYLIATGVTKLQCNKFINAAEPFIADYKEYIKYLCNTSDIMDHFSRIRNEI